MQDHTVRYVVNRANLSDPLVCLGQSCRLRKLFCQQSFEPVNGLVGLALQASRINAAMRSTDVSSCCSAGIALSTEVDILDLSSRSSLTRNRLSGLASE